MPTRFLEVLAPKACDPLDLMEAGPCNLCSKIKCKSQLHNLHVLLLSRVLYLFLDVLVCQFLEGIVANVCEESG